MAGKSTFLRQNALIAILAQIGAFVPASAADQKKLRRLGPGFVITRFHHPDGEPADFATSAVHATALMARDRFMP